MESSKLIAQNSVRVAGQVIIGNLSYLWSFTKCQKNQPCDVLKIRDERRKRDR